MADIETVDQLVESYRNGQRCFFHLEFENCENLSSLCFSGAVFKNCWLNVDFSKSDLTDTKFIDCDLKTTDFSNCNLTRASITGCTVESSVYTDAIIDEFVFDNNSAYSQVTGQDDFVAIYKFHH